jgi:uncharacterized protein (DUF1800 family)
MTARRWVVAQDDTRARIAHLYRRAGFGARPDELDAAAARGYEATVVRLLEPHPGPDPVAPPALVVTDPSVLAGAQRPETQRQLRSDTETLILWWLDRMALANPLPEKLALLWHGHFATAIQKVRLAAFMHRQNQIFRSLGAGSFEALTQAVAKDPAMLIWLDSNTNKKGHPNENFARELLELFTLGIGNYSEDDVKEAARCFTGWTLDRASGAFAFHAPQHDDGSKTVLGQSGTFGGEDVITRITRAPASAAFVVAKVWSHLAYPVTPSDPVVPGLVRAYAADLDIGKLVRAVFLHPQFVSAQARTGLVKQPIEFVVGALRATGLKPSAHADVIPLLTAMGQTPFEPPSVGGWPQNGYWLSTAAALARLRFAAAVASRADVTALGAMAPSTRPDAVARLLSVEWTPATRAALAKTDDARTLLTLALVAPEYVLN